MSDNIIWVVDLDANLDEAANFAATGKDWLLAQKIISTALCPVLAYGGAELFSRGDLACDWDAWEFQGGVSMCGLEIAIGRNVYHAGDNGLQGFACPKCGQQHVPEAVPWSDAVGQWYEGASHDMQCPSCGAQSSIVEWQFLESSWGFGNLAFGFWNWDIKDSIAEQLAAVLGHRCRLVYEHM